MTNKDNAWLITEKFFDTATHHPERELVFDPRFGRFTYRDIKHQAETLAWAFLDRGFRAGDIIILQLPNWAPFIVFHLALSAFGAITVNVPILLRKKEISEIIGITQANEI